MEEIKENKEKKRFSIKEFYDKHYKKLLLIPSILLLLAFIQIGVQLAETGDFFNRGVSLKGGLTITIEKSANIIELQKFLKDKFPSADISVREISQAGRQIGTTVEASDVDADAITPVLEENLGISKDQYSVEIIGSSLGASFFKETSRALILAFVCMGIVVFLYFRVPIPSLAVILCAFSDIITTLAAVNFLGMKLNTAGIASFLMLIGYSVDTDILLSTRVLKRTEGTVVDRIFGAMRTGLMMSITTITAVVVALMITQSDVINQIMTILLIGLLVDMIYTWIQNAGILRWYLEWKEKKHQNQNKNV